MGAIAHAEESDDDFLHGLVDDLRYLYQLSAEDLKGQEVELKHEQWCVLKHNLVAYVNDIETFAKRKREGGSTKILKRLIDARGELIRKLVEHYEVKKRAEKEKK